MTAAGSENATTVGSRHPLAESMLVHALAS